MRGPGHRRRSGRIALAIATPLLAALGCNPAPPPTPPVRPPEARTSTGKPAPARPSAATPAPITAPPPGGSLLRGTVSAPASLVGNNGASLITDNGGGFLGRVRAGVVGTNGASIVSNNGGSFLGRVRAGVVSNNGGGIVSNNGGGFLGRVRYAVAQAGEGEDALRNALLVLTDRDERFYLDADTGQAFTAATDAAGAYAFPITPTNGFPVGKEVVVTAQLPGDQRLVGFLVPAAGENALRVNVATTLATEYLRGAAIRRGQGLAAFDRAAFAQAVDQTQAAITQGYLPTVLRGKDEKGQDAVASVFDFGTAQVGALRDAYAMILAVGDPQAEVLRALTTAWRTLLGEPVRAVTAVAGNGRSPALEAVDAEGVVYEGDMRAKKPVGDPLAVPIGLGKAIAVSARGDLFYVSPQGVRWFHPDGRVSSFVGIGYQLADPVAAVVEREPGDDPSQPGRLIVADAGQHQLLRLAITDRKQPDAAGAPRFPVEFLAGTAGDTAAGTPGAVDGVVPVEGARPDRSRWRLADEGERRFVNTGAPVPNPARYAHLNGPAALARDELGNLYVADAFSHRIRVIVGAGADGKPLFGYRKPLDDNGDGVVDRFGEATPLKAGAIYTIAGHPAWDPAAPDFGGRWAAGFDPTPGKPAQEARFANPAGLAFRDGWLYVGDTDNHRVRRIERATGKIETVVGTGEKGGTGDGGPATQARLTAPYGLAFDPAGRLIVRDRFTLRQVDAKGVITRLAGGYPDEAPRAGIEGEALHSVSMPHPWSLGGGIVATPDFGVLFADGNVGHVRKLWRQWEEP